MKTAVPPSSRRFWAVLRPSAASARRRAFTLIELLTVIAIIGVLAGILIPVIGMVRSKARASASVSNLRQIFVALSLYADENRERFPMARGQIGWNDTENDLTQLSWAQQLRPYIPNKELFETPRFEREGSAYFLSSKAAFVASGNAFAAVQRSRIQSPSLFVLAGETNFPFAEPDFDKDDYTQNCLQPPETLMKDGTQAVLFADGHVAAFKDYDSAKMTFRYEGLAAW